jgi:hypothetical protein
MSQCLSVCVCVCVSVYPPITVWVCEAHEIMLKARGSIVVKALCYKSEGRGFETR